MANPEHLEKLKEGVEAWNQWRINNFCIHPDLSDSILRSIDFYHANLRGANLSDSNLKNVYLRDANLYGAYLRDADLEGADFSFALISFVDLSFANLRDSSFYTAFLKEAYLYFADLAGANLAGAYLKCAYIARANLQGTNLTGANFTEANLTGANLKNTNLKDANLAGANLKNTNLIGASLKRAEALSTNLKSSNITGACIQDLVISIQTNLQNVKCDYIYLKDNQEGRRPYDPDKIFVSGEFSKNHSIVLKTVSRRADLDKQGYYEVFHDIFGIHIENGYENIEEEKYYELIVPKNLGNFTKVTENLDHYYQDQQNIINQLKKGVKTWNQWRTNNPDVIPDLKYLLLHDANLVGVNLAGANLYRADLAGANLAGANLAGANLYSVKLSSADLSSADLSSANLNRVQALSTNLKGANLTAACIQDWNINNKTNLKGVKCDYIYLKTIYSEEGKKYQKYEFHDRRPHNPDKIFAPGQFTNLIQTTPKTVDLIFSEGIEWAAFLESFKQLQAEIKSEELSIQTIEKKYGGAFIIRVEVPESANKSEIQKYLEREYTEKLKAIEANYQKQLQAKEETIHAYRERGTDLLKMAEIMANIQQNTIINNNPNMFNQNGNFGIGHNEGNISDSQVSGVNNETSQKDGDQ